MTLLIDAPEVAVTRRRRSTAQREELIHTYAYHGLTIAKASALMGVGVAIAKKYARRAGVVFPDYKPRSLK